jgi:hypothetical protein
LQLLRNGNFELKNEVTSLKQKFDVDSGSLLLPGVGLSPRLRVGEVGVLTMNDAQNGIERSLLSTERSLVQNESSSLMVQLPSTSRMSSDESANGPSRSTTSKILTRARKWVSVSNFDPETSSLDVRNFVMDKLEISSESIVCAKITPRSIANPKFLSFKVRILPELMSALKDRNF